MEKYLQQCVNYTDAVITNCDKHTLQAYPTLTHRQLLMLITCTALAVQSVGLNLVVEVFPYRDGSRAVIDSCINPIELDNGVITLKSVIDELKTIVNNIISS